MDRTKTINYALHVFFIMAQAGAAAMAQSNPEWAWVNVGLGMIQSGAPSPFVKAAEK